MTEELEMNVTKPAEITLTPSINEGEPVITDVPTEDITDGSEVTEEIVADEAVAEPEAIEVA